MFGRKERSTPLQREQLDALENMRDDCIALFINSGLTQKQIHERGGPTPATISKWLYKETFFPRYSTIDSFLRALGYGLAPVLLVNVDPQRYEVRDSLSTPFIGRPRMPRKKGK